ncbi:FKBP-type peptidyl-prolyl cis-trans isomerase [Calidithermus roseus]|uniref:FKBP-type peptidyl-prolyl cis-trans isomerase SlyD n=1 Tax=Calidithermus roseus TaxID=1644118 RepID=A0A399ETJ1_9DEIN|nr:FKBP-type peptidyl-prolyl cis-trans isomerase [Calidithermus roseus]RIH85902.1 FKBP-type peptidyl-prolyl cis-trans isomerase SlyD [Calidithermus roseus]
MKVADKTVVQFEYVLRVDGEIADRTHEGETQTILIGHTHGLPAGLEAALMGREVGSFVVSVPPAQGYGEYDASKRLEVHRAELPADLEPGALLYAEDEAGNPVSYRVTAVNGDLVTLDANPKWAGKTLEYSITIHKVREAEPGELEHGHVHGEGGVHH